MDKTEEDKKSTKQTLRFRPYTSQDDHGKESGNTDHLCI